MDGHVTLEVECLDRLDLNGYISKLATGGGVVTSMRGQAMLVPLACYAVIAYYGLAGGGRRCE